LPQRIVHEFFFGFDGRRGFFEELLWTAAFHSLDDLMSVMPMVAPRGRLPCAVVASAIPSLFLRQIVLRGKPLLLGYVSVVFCRKNF